MDHFDGLRCWNIFFNFIILFISTNKTQLYGKYVATGLGREAENKK